MAVVGVVAVDAAGDEEDGVELEGDEVFGGADDDFVFVFDEAFEFFDGFGGEDEVALLGEGEIGIEFVEGKAAAVGGDHGEGFVGEAEVDAIEDEAGFFEGDGVGGEVEAGLELFLGEAEFLLVLDVRQWWEIFTGEAIEAEAGAATAEEGGIGGVGFDKDVFGGELFDDGAQFFGGEGSGTGLDFLGGDRATDKDI